MSRYTPGPWKWHGDYTLIPANPSPQHSATHTILSPDGPYGFLGASSAAVEQEFQANKSLIEAAPLLLEALEICRAQWIHSPHAEQCLMAIKAAKGNA